MAKKPSVPDSAALARMFDTGEATLLDAVDHVLGKGVVATGDVTLGVAGIDLIYLRLSALLSAADRILPRNPGQPRRRVKKSRAALRRATR